jgi:hypothetical protein
MKIVLMLLLYIFSYNDVENIRKRIEFKMVSELLPDMNSGK